jgi:hypothetical protein
VYIHADLPQGEHQHGLGKEMYKQTNKNQYHKQIAKHEARYRYIRKAQRRLRANQQQHAVGGGAAKKTKGTGTRRKGTSSAILPFEAEEPLPYSKPRDRFHISEQAKFPVRIGEFLDANEDDVAVNVSTWVPRP